MEINIDNIPNIAFFNEIMDEDEQILWAGVPNFKTYVLRNLMNYTAVIFLGILLTSIYVGIIIIAVAVYQICTILITANKEVYAYSNKRVMRWKGVSGTDFLALEFMNIKQVLTEKPRGNWNKKYNTGHLFFDDGVSLLDFRNRKALLGNSKDIISAFNNKSKHGWKGFVKINGVPLDYYESKVRWYDLENSVQIATTLKTIINTAKAENNKEQQKPSYNSASNDERKISATSNIGKIEQSSKNLDGNEFITTSITKPDLIKTLKILALPFLIEIPIIYFLTNYYTINILSTISIAGFFINGGYFSLKIMPLIPLYFPSLYKYTEETQNITTPKNTLVIYLILAIALGYSTLHIGIANFF